MWLFLKILTIIGVIILTLTILLVIFLLIPFKYDFSARLKGKEIKIDFKYFIVSFDAFVSFPKSNYYLRILGKTIFDSSNKKISDSEKNIEEDNKRNEGELYKKYETKEYYDINDLKNDKIETINSKIDYLVNLIKRKLPKDEFYVLKRILDAVVSLIGKITPSKYDIDVDYGVDDPYTYGMSYAIFAPLSAITGDKFSLRPRLFEGGLSINIEASQNVMAMHIVVLAIRLLFDKRFRKVIFKKNK